MNKKDTKEQLFDYKDMCLFLSIITSSLIVYILIDHNLICGITYFIATVCCFILAISIAIFKLICWIINITKKLPFSRPKHK